ncbi:MAG: DNA-binding protein [Elusimicrobia bacterium]|nr:DNA-binding protein [Elusimicrobiota bacterium]
MRHRDLPDGRIVLKFLPGEELVSTLTAFLNDRRIYGGSLTGIGAGKDVELGHFSEGRYHKVRFAGPVEFVSLTGNVSRVEDGAAFPHLHAVISLTDMSTAGGHVFQASIEPTCEVYLWPSSEPVERRMDAAKGLKLLDL